MRSLKVTEIKTWYAIFKTTYLTHIPPLTSYVVDITCNEQQTWSFKFGREVNINMIVKLILVCLFSQSLGFINIYTPFIFNVFHNIFIMLAFG